MAYIGPAPNPGQNREVDDISSGFNGSEVNFTLQVNSQNVSPGSANAIIVSLGGVVQNPGTDYTIAASTLTFTTAPASGLSFFGLVLGQSIDTEGTADGSIVNASVSGSAAIAGTKISPNFGSQNIVTTGSISGAAGTFTSDLDISEDIRHIGDTDTKLKFPAADTITLQTAGSERVRVDSDGRFLVGTAASVGAATDLKLQVIHPTGSSLLVGSSTASTGNTALINFAPANSITGTQLVSESTEDFSVTANRSAKFTIRCRVNGNFSDNLVLTAAGQQDNLSITNAGDHFTFRNTTTSNTGTLLVVASSRNSTNGSYYLAQWGSTSTTRFQVFDSGDVQNISGTFQAISDKTLKENIVDAGSQWDDIKNLKVRKFNFKETTDPNKKTMIGVIAQEAETVCPNLVETSKTKQGDEEKEFKTFKYSILYMKAIKCLQEAQARIETLETKVAALEAA